MLTGTFTGLFFSFWTFGAIFGALLFAVSDACGVESAADDVVADAWQILDTSSADKHDGVLLEVVSFSRDIGVHFLLVCQSYTCDLSHC